MRRTRFFAALITTIVLVPTRPAWAQPERYELGRRVRAFEAAWDRQTDAAARERATAPLKQAVSLFFGFRLADAGRAVTDARFALRSADAPTAAETWAASLELRPETRLADANQTKLTARLQPFYKVDGPAPEGARLIVRVGAGPAAKTAADTAIAAETWPQEVSLDLTGIGEGDHTVHAEVQVAGRALADLDIGLSLVTNLGPRRDALRQAIAGWPNEPTTDRETAKALLALVDRFAEGGTLETDYPLARLLAEAEAVAATLAQGRTHYDRTRTGQHWLTLALPGGGKGVVRVQVPERASQGAKMPLVLALHGAGGSENMFFDAYGNGAITRFCRERDWVLAAPRGNGMGAAQTEELVEELAKVYPIDQSKVMVVGHSMGAMQAVGLASRSPEKYAAVAALGGGGMVRPNPGLAALPFYVAVGTEDFALSGARGLNNALKRADVRTLSYREYEAVEHLAIVQAALPEVFAFFDKVVGRGAR